MGVDDVPWPDLTHICFAFGSIATDGTYAVNITDTALMSQLFTAAANNGVNAILSIGGWGYGSAEYSSMVATSESRSQFINSLLDLATEYNIKGVDLDWEYPGRPSDESVPYNATGDIPNYTLLLQEIAAAFGGYEFTISAAVAAMMPFSDDISDMVEYFDWLGLMFYDFATGTVDETMSDSPLTGDVSAEAGVAAWYAAGLPYDKMVLGIPAYGRSFTLANVLFPAI
jgi:chitinase